MNHPQPSAPASIDIDTLLLIVVGAHPRAELHDRAPAYHLRQLVLDCLAARASGEGEATAMQPLVVSDVWYLNDPSLRACPTISVGGPGVNALSAYLGDKIPGAFIVDDVLMVQLDVTLEELTACCWGVDADSTRAAVDAFAERYLEAFVDAAVRRRAV